MQEPLKNNFNLGYDAKAHKTLRDMSENAVATPLVRTYAREQSLPTIESNGGRLKAPAHMTQALLKTRRKYNNLVSQGGAPEDGLARTMKAAKLPEGNFFGTSKVDEEARNDSKRFADIRVKLRLKQIPDAYHKDSLAGGCGIGGSSRHGSPEGRSLTQRKALEAHSLIPKPLTDNLWGEINNYAYERHIEDQRKQKEDEIKRREEIRNSLSR